MGKIETFPEIVPVAAGRIAAKLLNRHSPHEIAEAIEILLDVLDALGGDPDAEDATDAEDDFALSPRAQDYGQQQEADNEAGAYAEWHTMPTYARKVGVCMVQSCGNEDDEEDDPSGQRDEDGVNTDLTVLRRAGPGCLISDSDSGDDGI